MDIEKKYKTELTHYLNCIEDQLFLFWKGRVGLYAALKAVGLQTGDEVIVQAFTCVVVPNAIIYTGATPIYIDIQADSFNASFEEIKKKVSTKTRVIITQNTFGLSSDVERISAYCTENGLVCIEDCTHGFGGKHDGKSNGSFADFAFYSTQWNKPFSTGIGGILRVNNLKYLSNIQELEHSACVPTLKERVVLNTLLTAQKYFLTDISYWALKKMYRQLSAWNVVVGSSAPEEIAAPVLPDYFLKKGCKIQYRKGVKALKGFNNILTRRKKNAMKISALLKSHKKTYVFPVFESNHSFLIYPILVKERAEFLKLSENTGLPMGDWFVSPIHPVTKNFEQWKLNCDDFQVATQISKQIVNIPLDQDNIEKYIVFLGRNMDLLM